MGFIYGIINLDGKTVQQEEISPLATAVKWEGFHEQNEVEDNYALGYCYHPLRESKAGIFKFEDLIILADIRIYNAPELKKQFPFDSPEEGFAKAYLLWGTNCANYINGDFSVVVIHRKKNEVHLFRDHIGARPLTYWFHENRLIFASHEFGIVKSGLVTTSLCEEKLINELFRFKEIYKQTVFQRVVKVIPGHCLSFSQNGKKLTEYWKPEEIKQNNTLSFNDAVAKLRALMIAATLSRMESGKTGVHVSGGIDSTGVACILADYTKEKSQLIGYSWTPEILQGEFEGIDEKEFIEAFSTEKKVLINYLKLEENEFSKNAIIPEFEKMQIEHPTMKMAGKDGVKTLFSGWGGDEFVSLSTRGTYNHLFFNFKWLTLGRFIYNTGIKSGILRLRTEVLPLFIPFGLLHTYQPKNWSNLNYLKTYFIKKHWKNIFFHNQKNIFGYGNRTQFMLNLLHNYHIPGRMDSWAIHAERYGFEYKYPLLDKEVLEFWFSIPVAYTYQNMQSRLLYREAMKGILTEKIRVRKDKGEGLRIAYTQQNQKKGEKLVENLVLSISEREHLTFFRPESIKKTLNQVAGKHKFKERQRQNMFILYLRYVELVKKYLC
jgi:asparagine synthase (glutamine-hydrolysing)